MRCLLFYLLLFPLWLNAQPDAGAIRGKVVDSGNGELLPFVQLMLIDSLGIIRMTGETDIDGHFIFRDVPPCNYCIVCKVTGYSTDTIKCQVKPERLTFVKVLMNGECTGCEFGDMDDSLLFKPFYKEPPKITVTKEELEKKLSKKEKRKLQKIRSESTALPKRE